MRYENWDVLLFPESSKVPMQEFKTQCFVTKDRESPYLYNPALVSPTSACHLPPPGSCALLPVLTTFIPSITPNAAFRVSIHNWDKPRPSRLMDSLLQPDESSLFEARIFIDGNFVAGSVFSERSIWPLVIDLSSYVDKTGNQDNLRFPPFHQEILDQRHWDAGELYGRIRVVISEGFSRPHRNPPFERVREVIAFAFQHAPLHVLELSNIAWPNASMWAREPRLFKYTSGGGTGDLREPEDTHAHSPTRQNAQQPLPTSDQTKVVRPSVWGYKNYEAIYSQAPQWQGVSSFPRWCPPETMPDPFTESYHDPHRGCRPSWEDISMPDYSSSSISSRAISHMTGISYEHSKHPSIQAPTMDDEAYTQLMGILPKPLTYTSRTPATSKLPGTLPVGSKPSAAAQARSASYARSGSQASARKDISQPITREVSGASSISVTSTTAVVGNRLQVSPSVGLRSRKERISQGAKENAIIVETLHRDGGKTTPSKSSRHASGALETPTDTKRRVSGSSVRGETSTPVKEAIVISPPQKLAEIEESNIELSNAALEIAEIE